MQHERFDGLIAATVTPMDASGALALDRLPPLVEKLSADGVVGMFACGRTGEGLSLTIDERQETLEATLALARGRMRTIAHVGHNSLAAAADLARHAQAAGADAVAATSPSYFKPPDITTLVDSMAAVAEAAPALPFYYYHIPGLTHVTFDMVAFLEEAAERIPNLVGLKYTYPTLHEFQACRQFADQRFEMLWGVDEMLLPAWSIGAAAAVGSTYNVAGPLYRQIIADFR